MEKKSKFHKVIFVYSIIQAIYGVILLVNGIMGGITWVVLAAVGLLLCLVLRKRVILPFIISVLLIISSVCAVAIYVLGSDGKDAKAQYALVLGYALDNDKMTETLKMRLDKTLEYNNENPETIFVLCGGVTGKNTVSEASVMQEYLLKEGIPQERIVLEDKSTNTIENIKNAQAYINKNSVVVISSQYHLLRAKLICQKTGIVAKAIGANAPLMLIPNQLLMEQIGLISAMLVK